MTNDGDSSQSEGSTSPPSHEGSMGRLTFGILLWTVVGTVLIGGIAVTTLMFSVADGLRTELNATIIHSEEGLREDIGDVDRKMEKLDETVDNVKDRVARIEEWRIVTSPYRTIPQQNQEIGLETTGSQRANATPIRNGN